MRHEARGAALADVLLGLTEPGGRLPTTWPRRAQDAPVLGTTPTDGTLGYDEGVFIGYRGWRNDPLFPFGHGLGYTTWAYESLRVEPAEVAGAPVAVVTLRNTGSRPGREVVQLYVGPTDPDPDRPIRQLAGFTTVTAAPDETVTVRVPLAASATRIWAGQWRTVPGHYTVEAARGVADVRLAAPFEVADEASRRSG